VLTVRSLRSQGVPLPARPPVRLVDAGVLSALMQRADAPHDADASSSSSTAVTRGVTLTQEVILQPVARAATSAAALWGLGAPEALRRRRGCRVTCIALLSSLPRLLSGAVLAHEACHAYLRLCDAYPHPLAPRVEEGLCQLLALLWLERHARTMSSSGDAEADARMLAHAAQAAHAIRSDASETYGGGVRDALQAYQRCGLHALLLAVQRTGRVPM
jgi:hypothetical protein